MDKVSLAEMTDADLPFMQQVYASTRQDEMAMTGWPQSQIDEFLAMQCMAQHQHYQQYYPQASFDVIVWAGQPVGRLYVDRTFADIRIVDIALLPPYRGKGIGGYLLEQLLCEARDQGRALAIHVEKNNPAMSLYKRLGFVKTEDKGVYDFMERPPQPLEEYSE